ncbi:MAG: ATP-dependent sacrificial sulfur transferase LarE [Magnetococcales bacterium]|nr:ATP-dependent sacrificial sulfur transferase LarE [Magnetococcales bacterium]
MNPSRIPEPLRLVLQRFDHLLTAFSGGVDSTCLLAAAAAVLGVERVLGLTALSPTLPASERQEAEALARRLGVRLILRETRELDHPEFAANGPDRCFHCKSALFTLGRAMIDKLPEPSRWSIAYGANADDLLDIRPGMEAARRMGIHAPLLEAGMNKAAVRELSRALGLPTADKPAFACLSSRFPTFTVIDAARLRQVELAEEVLREHKFRVFRVRYHGALARVELGLDELGRLDNVCLKTRLTQRILETGFQRVEFDPRGYRMGGR